MSWERCADCGRLRGDAPDIASGPNRPMLTTVPAPARVPSPKTRAYLALCDRYGLGYLEREIVNDLFNHPRHHTSACLTRQVDAFCDDVPEPGCSCGHEARIAALVAERYRAASDERRAAA